MKSKFLTLFCLVCFSAIAAQANENDKEPEATTVETSSEEGSSSSEEAAS